MNDKLSRTAAENCPCVLGLSRRPRLLETSGVSASCDMCDPVFSGFETSLTCSLYQVAQVSIKDDMSQVHHVQLLTAVFDISKR